MAWVLGGLWPSSLQAWRIKDMDKVVLEGGRLCPIPRVALSPFFFVDSRSQAGELLSALKMLFKAERDRPEGLILWAPQD